MARLLKPPVFATPGCFEIIACANGIVELPAILKREVMWEVWVILYIKDR